MAIAATARYLWHRRVVQLGHRRFRLRHPVSEPPTASLTAIVSGRAAAFLQLGVLPARAPTGICAWLGRAGWGRSWPG